MIIDKTNHLPEYGALLPHLKEGLEAVQALGPVSYTHLTLPTTSRV